VFCSQKQNFSFMSCTRPSSYRGDAGNIRSAHQALGH
jgi:hypothetical protein